VQDLVDRIGVEPVEVGRDRRLQRVEERLVGTEFSEVGGDDLDTETVARQPPERRFVADLAAPEPVAEEEPPSVPGSLAGSSIVVSNRSGAMVAPSGSRRNSTRKT